MAPVDINIAQGPFGVKGTDGNNIATPDNPLDVRDIPLADYDTDNSRDTALGASEEWFGEWVEYGKWPGMSFFALFDTEFEMEIQWSPDGVTQDPGLLGSTPLTVVETASVPGLYAAVHDANIPVNAYYRVRVKNLTGSAATFGQLRSWRLRAPYGGAYDILSVDPNEFAQALLTKAVLSGRLPGGGFSNVALTPRSSIQTAIEGHSVTPSGALWSEGTIDYVVHDFGAEFGAKEVGVLQDLSTGGTAAHDATDGGVVFATGAAAGNTAIFLSQKTIPYNKNVGHGILADITLFEEPDSAGISGDAYVEWGVGDGAGNGFGFGYDASGYYTFLKKGGTYIAQDYQDDGAGGTDWNGDPLDGGTNSLFRRAGTPEAIAIAKDNLYRVTTEFLYAAEQNFFAKAPGGLHLLAHTHEYPNAHAFISAETANLNVYVEIHNDTSSGGDLKFRSGSWRGGAFSNNSVQIARQPDGDLVEIRADGLAQDVDGVNVETTDELSPAATYQSGWVDTDGWDTIQIDIASDQVSATDGILIEYTDDANATTPTVRATASATYSADDVSNGSRNIVLGTRNDGFRITYTNGGSTTSGFYLGVTLRVAPQPPQGGLKSGINATDQAVTTRGGIFAEKDSGAFSLIGQSDGGGFRTSVKEHEVETPIKGLDTLKISNATVGTTAVQVATSRLLNSRTIAFKSSPNNNKNVTIGTSAAVTAGAGWVLDPGADVAIEITDDYAGAFWAISTSAGQALNIMEVGDSSPPA